MLCYPVIDVQRTGRRLRRECDRLHVTVKELQQFLGLSALQSVYNWFQGRTLPSLDNFYALSRYLGVHMEELVVTTGHSQEVPARDAARGMERRCFGYFWFRMKEEAFI